MSEAAGKDETIQQLEEKIVRQKWVLTIKDAALADRSRQLDAMAWVWCDGGCHGGVFRHTPLDLTEEIVAEAERNVKRLRTWFDNVEFRKQWAGMTEAERAEWFSAQREARNRS
jgi:hypothetical protein